VPSESPTGEDDAPGGTGGLLVGTLATCGTFAALGVFAQPADAPTDPAVSTDERAIVPSPGAAERRRYRMWGYTLNENGERHTIVRSGDGLVTVTARD
jgi:hypothetical protein